MVGNSPETVVTQVLAERLTVAPEDIVFNYSDSQTGFNGVRPQGSRFTAMIAGACVSASIKLEERLLRFGAHMLQRRPEDLELRNGCVSVKGLKGQEKSFAEIALTSSFFRLSFPDTEEFDSGPETTAVYDHPVSSDPAPDRSRLGIFDPIVGHICHIVAVKVDAGTGKVDILDYAAVHDNGTIVNPRTLCGQVWGGKAHGIGSTLFEHFVYDADGQFTNPNFAEFAMPTANETPRNFKLGHIETPTPFTENGIKGGGEGGRLGAPSALTTAIDDALSGYGVTISSLPVTPPILRSLILDREQAIAAEWVEYVKSSSRHHHLRRHRCDPYAVDVSASAGQIRGHRGAGHRGGQGGAAILHLNARDEQTGHPDQPVEGFRRIVEPIAAATDAVSNLTTGGSPCMTVDERVQPAATLAPGLASLNMRSMNLGLFPMPKRHPDDAGWERAHQEDSRKLIFQNTFKDIAFVLDTCRVNGTRFEFECHDIVHLDKLAHFADADAIQPPFFVQTVFGLLGGIGAQVDEIAHMRRIALRLFGDDLVWSALGAGANQMRVAATVAASGGHVRVGLEDSLWAGPGRLATSNAEQVEAVKALIGGLGLRAATPAEAQQILGLSPVRAAA